MRGGGQGWEFPRKVQAEDRPPRARGPGSAPCGAGQQTGPSSRALKGVAFLSWVLRRQQPLRAGALARVPTAAEPSRRSQPTQGLGPFVLPWNHERGLGRTQRGRGRERRRPPAASALSVPWASSPANPFWLRHLVGWPGLSRTLCRDEARHRCRGPSMPAPIACRGRTPPPGPRPHTGCEALGPRSVSRTVRLGGRLWFHLTRNNYLQHGKRP